MEQMQGQNAQQWVQNQQQQQQPPQRPQMPPQGTQGTQGPYMEHPQAGPILNPQYGPQGKDAWEKVESKLDIWVPEKEGDTMVGKVLAVQQGLYGSQWTLQTPEGYEVKTPSHKVLQARMESVAIGSMVKIVYLGAQESKIRGRNPTSLYEVYVQRA